MFITKINQLMVFKEIISIYCGKNVQHLNTTCDKTQFLIVTVSGAYSYNLCFHICYYSADIF
jgi:hypothetical protein